MEASILKSIVEAITRSNYSSAFKVTRGYRQILWRDGAYWEKVNGPDVFLRNIQAQLEKLEKQIEQNKQNESIHNIEYDIAATLLVERRRVEKAISKHEESDHGGKGELEQWREFLLKIGQPWQFKWGSMPPK